jgi:hypothetical protein
MKNDVTGRQVQTDPALDRLVRSGNISVILAAKILALIQDSGASQVEILSALGAVRELLPALHISLSNDSLYPDPAGSAE